MKSPNRNFRNFLRDDSGIILAETLITLPILIWALTAMFIYWDVFRTVNTLQKASYTVADLVSRQDVPILPAYATGLQNVLEFLMQGQYPVRMRITSFEYNSVQDKYCRNFSFSPLNKVPPATETEIQAWEPRIPLLEDRESVFVVETWLDFDSRLDAGLLGLVIGVDDATYGEFVITRPRHRRILLDGQPACV